MSLRSASRLSQNLRRYITTQASASSSNATTSTPLPKPTLPPQKLRALVSLYHKSDKFITPETLDAEIDKEFQEDIFHGAYTEYPYSRLREDLDKIRREPQVGRSGLSANTDSEKWSDRSSRRQKQVKTALYGMEDDRRAGLEVLLEERERIAKHRRNDQTS
ncbi:hypothetical protein QCA50_000287 [Cerrena zonata]|uniref:Uncharacterized protein n=1 Tax=Cerrena zonata TaxID=2478898 RepID=A0AAW0GSL9_9APHY